MVAACIVPIYMMVATRTVSIDLIVAIFVVPIYLMLVICTAPIDLMVAR